MNLLLKQGKFGFSSIQKMEQLGLANIKTHRVVRPSRSFKQGQQAPDVYNEVYAYPSDYKPWTINYSGNGIFILSAIIAWYAFYQYECTYLRRTELSQRVDRERKNI